MESCTNGNYIIQIKSYTIQKAFTYHSFATDHAKTRSLDVSTSGFPLLFDGHVNHKGQKINICTVFTGICIANGIKYSNDNFNNSELIKYINIKCILSHYKLPVLANFHG